MPNKEANKNNKQATKWSDEAAYLLLLAQMPGAESFVSQHKAPHLWLHVSLGPLYMPLNLGWHQTALTWNHQRNADNNKKLKTKHTSLRPLSCQWSQCVCLTKCELFLKGRGMREAEHLASLPVVLTMVLTYPLILSKLGHGRGWGWVCVCVCVVMRRRRRWWGF